MRALLLSACLALPLAAQAADALSPAQQEAVDARIRAYLLDNPEIIIEAVERLRAREAQAQIAADAELIEKHAEALFDTPEDAVFGPTDATMVMVEFADYNCGYCKQMHGVVADLLEEESDLKLIYKQLPVLGPESVLAARAAMAAQELDAGKFVKLHNALLSHRGALSETLIMRMARDAGLPEDALRAKMEEPQIEARIQENYKLSRIFGISGTPAFVLGDELLRGAAPIAEFRRRITALRDGA